MKPQLRAHTDAAIAEGVFGVPTIEIDGRLFWGVDALPMVAASLRGDPWFDGPAWDAAAQPVPGVKRRWFGPGPCIRVPDRRAAARRRTSPSLPLRHRRRVAGARHVGRRLSAPPMRWM